MLETKQYSVTVDDKLITIETGKYAFQAGGSVTVRQGDTMLLAVATMDNRIREGIDYFPLRVDYEERLYAGGRIPGSYFRREGRPSENATLIARLVDRPLRPLFPKGMRNDVQIVIYALSADGETPIDVLAILAASTALTISDVPFMGPVGAVRVAQVDGKFVINPTYEVIGQSALNLRVAGTRDATLMVECNADQVEESVMVEALQVAASAMQPLIDLQEQMRAEIGKPKREYKAVSLPDGAVEAVQSWLGSKLEELYGVKRAKAEEGAALEALQLELLEALSSEDDDAFDERAIRGAFQEVYKTDVRTRILEQKKRPDGRGPGEIRPLAIEVNLSPRAHGSGLFSRGETQILTVAALGTPRERQELDTLQPESEKRYMHHYNFPPFSVGEVRPLFGASRRDIGHGALAEKALIPVLPALDDFPYTLRLVSEALSSNGSTSMAAVCASTLALMDTGVPISAPVAGIAMGLVMKDDNYAILTDIQGVEDHYGDMDFKVAGTRAGITALQMDIKLTGISADLMAEALHQAREARIFILDAIEAVMPAARDELKPHAPRMTVLKIDPQKIGAVIGPGGKIIRSIQEETGVRIDVQDDGTIYIAATDGPSADKAREIVEGLTEEAVVGRIYTGKVVRTTDFGAFVEILPNKDGLVHISQLASERVESVEDVAKVGDEITVMVTSIDGDNRIRLSRQAVLEGWTPEEAMERDKRTRRPSGGRSGGRGRGGRSSGSRDKRRS